MTTILTILTLLAISSPTVHVETLDGARLTGQLRSLSIENAQLETSEGQQVVPTDRLMSITFPEVSQESPSQQKSLVTLVDGSQIVVDDYRVTGETARLFVEGLSIPIDIPARDINAVRFSNESENLNEAWGQLQKNATYADRLVVAKDGVLDYHSGSLGEVTDSRVVFTLDGDPLKVNRKKIFGITYYHPAGRATPKPLGRLATSDGSRWAFVAATIDDGKFQLKTSLELELSFPVEKVARLDFAEGKIVYLSDIEPESVSWTPYLTIDDETKADQTKNLAIIFGPKFNQSFQAGPLILEGKSYAKGMAIHSRSVITYRLDKKYGRLTAIVGIADRVRPRGNVQLKIEADGHVLLDREISGTEPAIPIDLDLAQADRLMILVDFGRQTDIADRLILGDVKVIE